MEHLIHLRSLNSTDINTSNSFQKLDFVEDGMKSLQTNSKIMYFVKNLTRVFDWVYLHDTQMGIFF